MGYCGACGKKSIGDELYCNKCGGKIKEKKARTGWTQRMSNIIFAIFLLFSLFIGVPVLILSGGKLISKRLAGYPLWEKSEEQIMKECLQQCKKNMGILYDAVEAYNSVEDEKMLYLDQQELRSAGYIKSEYTCSNGIFRYHLEGKHILCPFHGDIKAGMNL